MKYTTAQFRHVARFALVGLTWALPTAAFADHGQPSETAVDPRCDALFEQAVSRLAAEQYPAMRKVAQDRMAICPDPLSEFVLGLAEANMLDSLTVSDPAQRERLRGSALQHLRVAAAGEQALEPRWGLTAHEWIVRLEELGRGPQGEEIVVEPSEDNDEDFLSDDDVPPAPPPQPRPVFPWGPLLLGVAGVGALTTGVVLRVQASAEIKDAKKGAAELLELSHSGEADQAQLRSWALQAEELRDNALSRRRWADAFLIGGGAALIGAAVWYCALPPKGKWRWALVPTGLRLTARF